MPVGRGIGLPFLCWVPGCRAEAQPRVRNIALNLWMSGQAKPSKEPGFVKEFNFEKLDQNKTLEWLQVPLMNFHGIAMVAPAKFGSCVCVHLGLGQGRGNRQCAHGG